MPISSDGAPRPGEKWPGRVPRRCRLGCGGRDVMRDKSRSQRDMSRFWNGRPAATVGAAKTC